MGFQARPSNKATFLLIRLLLFDRYHITELLRIFLTTAAVSILIRNPYPWLGAISYRRRDGSQADLGCLRSRFILIIDKGGEHECKMTLTYCRK